MWSNRTRLTSQAYLVRLFVFGGRPMQFLLPSVSSSDTATGTLVSFSMNPDKYNGKVSPDVGEINVSLIATEGGHEWKAFLVTLKYTDAGGG